MVSAKPWAWGVAFSLMMSFFFVQALPLIRKEDPYRVMMMKFNAKRAELQQSLSQDDLKHVGQKGTNFIYFVMGEVAGSQGAHLELSKLLKDVPPSVRKELAQEITEDLTYFESLSFAPESYLKGQEDKKKIRQRIKKVIEHLEKAIKLAYKSKN